ncbi:uncharacterized protein LOC143019338 [Oratosquilla oratoria]|uniref:uncharacterized protein LOC143019338 n=1 Tax=Oratosquilla oratoria TaxID=337810 RepID=UPI003F764B02
MVNKLIETNNSATNAIHLNKLTGEYKPGYCYGNVKIHKPGKKIRPIIAQIPKPTYHLSKRLCALLTPYVPATYSLTSACDFIDILKHNNANGFIASLDAESLFTQIPVNKTIDFICDKIYRDNSTPKLEIPENILRRLLICCTSETPFTCPQGNLYSQVDGVAMGSPFGVLFVNFFMGSIEELIFRSMKKPDIYCRYIKVNDYQEVEKIRLKLQEATGLKFTAEHSVGNSMPFLDVLVTQSGHNFTTNVYTKPSNGGQCLNGNSECPNRYKQSTIGAYVRRALTHCDTWSKVHQELIDMQRFSIVEDDCRVY